MGLVFSHIMREIMRAQCADRNLDLFNTMESEECIVMCTEYVG